ncbi:NAD-dependent epimerase/dehydratase family protein [Rathayibacter toxicus]|uniref:dTDP-glucose 4,6-dehydratase/UDP-glucose 4-epimerase n=1 Tax=Rathayibacter toxicus TaxID=145458 RepID=A0A5P5X6U2_9MICO|nr:NAD-dependent epimerase/dehydratase family protein [Rathayibacter toxicus]PPI54158.1 epimerase [Rathayibacter toxicus]QFF92444.1 dTDP-glucose 4,6-dehydratase/UDP-glucose 4-epimerase [Rathayibacter toxicus]QOD11145.1 NAD-dependent epimerase/dehydratase family protein [Rathayibacter toxicus]QWL27888.1 NAD-dependent epimerase/dehydratase family protein [Rathayibacter toxicus]
MVNYRAIIIIGWGNGMDWNGRKVALVGGAGFIGHALAVRLLRSGASVTVIDDLSAPPLSPVAGELVHEHAEEMTAAQLENTDVVFHLAANKSVPRSFRDRSIKQRNIDMASRVIQACQDSGVPRVVVASSCEIYGQGSSLPNNENDEHHPRSPYAESKSEVEHLILDDEKMRGTNATIVRLFNVYGPGERPDAIVPKLCASIVAGEAFPVEGDGHQKRDFSYISTAIDHLVNIAAVPSVPVVNVGSGSSTSVNEIVELVAQKRPHVHVERQNPRQQDIAEFRADTALLNSISGEVNDTSLSLGLDRTLAWWERKGPDAARQALTHERNED